MITLYHAPRSRSSIAYWLLEELGVPYRVENMDLEAGDTQKADYLAINPLGKVPAIKDGDMAVSETGAICLHLADTYSAGTLAPLTTDPARGAYLRWLFFGAGCVEPAFMQLNLKFETPRTAASWGNADVVLSVLRDGLKAGPYLLGEKFSAADIYVGSQVRFGLMFNFFEPEPVFTTYVQRLDARPAAQSAARKSS